MSSFPEVLARFKSISTLSSSELESTIVSSFDYLSNEINLDVFISANVLPDLFFLYSTAEANQKILILKLTKIIVALEKGRLEIVNRVGIASLLAYLKVCTVLLEDFLDVLLEC